MKLCFSQIYNEKDWVGYMIDQAMRVCDKLLIVEGAKFLCFDDLPARSDDGTLDIISDKTRVYPGRIEIWPDGCDKGNFRRNGCANNQAALERCKTGDYFIVCEPDEYYTDSFIDDMNEAMREGEIDCMNWTALQFAFGFKWVFNQHPKVALLKKIPGAYFVPMFNPRGFGPNRVTIERISCFHYSWVKTRERWLRRARVGMYKGMPEWFASNYDSIKLAEGAKIRYVNGDILTLRKYEGPHPSVLDNHPWRHVEDIRRLNA